MNIRLADFQIDAIRRLMESMESDKREIVLKSCTGSGKTIILTHFMDEYQKCHGDVVFVWLTPGKGDLEEQSKAKMDKYIHGASTKLLSDIMASGFEAGDACFINWEKLTKKGNNALKESERTNFLEHVEHARDAGLRFIVIVDESHQNDTLKADEIIELFKTDKIIRCSATPKPFPNALIVDVPEDDVIAEGLIKKLLIINENFPQSISVDDHISYLLERSITKQRELRSAFLQRDVDVNPLIIIQIPSKSDLLLDRVERYLETQGISYENNQLAVWLDNKKQNLDDIEEPNAEPIAVIIKQAVATGWDCPRAHILVKLRDNMSEVFEIQTIGRIRRMPEAKHYESELLDNCYLYTFDEKFTENVKQNLGNNALNELHLYLKPEHSEFSLVSEYKTDVPFPRDAQLALKVIANHFGKVYHTDGKTRQNAMRLKEYVISGKIEEYTRSGSVSELTNEQFNKLNVVTIQEDLDTHKHGREYHHCAAEIGLKINLDYTSISTILFRLFCKDKKSDYKILNLEIRDFYAFVINNKDRLRKDISDSMADDTAAQLTLGKGNITEKPIGFPGVYVFTYDSLAKAQDVMNKNVYRDYLSSAEPRSTSEKLFEHYCESSTYVSWFYKNGDKGPEYFSIVYNDNFGKQKSFYPDYVVGTTDGRLWIIETKGGFTRTGQSEDIDKYTPKKFAVLKRYIDKYGLNGGIVRQDKQSMRLCICTDKYNEDIKSDSWQLLENVFRKPE